MEPMKSKIKGMFVPVPPMMDKKSSFSVRGNGKFPEEWEVRPGGMLVQKRNTDDSNSYSGFSRNSIPVPTIKVTVKFGSSCHEIRISSQASFGELKKMLAEHTGVHPQDQKLMYKKKERDSKAYLDVARVKDGSKIVLIEDIRSRERRCLELLKSDKIEKATKSLQQISLEVDRLGEKVKSWEAKFSRGEKVAEEDVNNLTDMLMKKFVELDSIFVQGELKLQKTMQERRVQKYIENLDQLKPKNCTSNGKVSFQQQESLIDQMPTSIRKGSVQSKERNVTAPALRRRQQPQQQLKSLMRSESVVVTTKWETFD